MANNNVKITNDLKNPKEFGDYHRLVIMTGGQKGRVFYLHGKRILIGRGENVDVQLLDQKVSKSHAELVLVNDKYVLTDLSTQNGIIINDRKIKQKELIGGEKIVFGQTVVKYSKIKVMESDGRADVIFIGEETPEQALKIQIDKAITANTKKPLKSKKKDEIEEDFVESEKIAPINNNGKSKTIVLVVAFLAIVFIFFMDDSADKEKKSKKSEENGAIVLEDQDSKRSKAGKEDPEVKKKFEMLIHSGRREFREGNYFRAMEEFRRADLLIPGSGMAGYLMSRAKQRLDDDVKKNFDKANKDLDAKKYQGAIASYCEVMQLLQRYPEDERYKNANDKILALEVELGLEKGEIKCFEEKPIDSKN